jgi:hypothetical protein
MKVTSLTVAMLLVAILIVRWARTGRFSLIWGAASGDYKLAA